jgi:hypothetical protein
MKRDISPSRFSTAVILLSLTSCLFIFSVCSENVHSVVFPPLDNIPRVSVEVMYETNYKLPDYPVIYTYPRTSNFSSVLGLEDLAKISGTLVQPDELFAKSSVRFLRNNHGKTKVKLSSSNAYSHGIIETTLNSYLTTILGDSFADMSSSSLKANESYYLFGHNYEGIWEELSSLYRSPPCHLCDKAGAKTPGLGGKNSGVSFHFHGPGFSEVIHGSKQWFLFPSQFSPLVTQLFHNNMTVVSWYDKFYPFFANETFRDEVINNRRSLPFLSSVCSEDSTDDDNTCSSSFLSDPTIENLLLLQPHLYECTIFPGEVLYFPSFWMHATLNRDDYNFFFSHFLDLQLMKE